MSHAYGEIILADQVVGYFEYDGTADVILPKIWRTRDELDEHWREDESFDRHCTCGQPPQAVLIYRSYGYGGHAPGKACLNCMVILGPYMWYPDYAQAEVDGHPICGEARAHVHCECSCFEEEQL